MCTKEVRETSKEKVIMPHQLSKETVARVMLSICLCILTVGVFLSANCLPQLLHGPNGVLNKDSFEAGRFLYFIDWIAPPEWCVIAVIPPSLLLGFMLKAQRTSIAILSCCLALLLGAVLIAGSAILALMHTGFIVDRNDSAKLLSHLTWVIFFCILYFACCRDLRVALRPEVNPTRQP